MSNYKKLLCNLLLGLLVINMVQMPVYAKAPYPDVFAESAVLIDAKTGQVLYGKRENTRQYPASITKLLTALVAIENQRPTDIITMSKEAVFGIERNSSHIGLDVGEEITFDQGLHALLLQSANEVANGIAELCDGSIEAFAKHASQRAKELGAKNSNFTNPHGLHDPNHYTTAYDMALISAQILKEPYFREVMDTPTYQIPFTNKCDEIRYLSQPHKLLNQQRYGKTYREDVIGGKTGYTSKAGNTLVTMAKRGDIELISVVLKSNPQNLYVDTNMILDYGFDHYKSISLLPEDSVIGSVPMYTVKSGQLIHVADCDICVEDHINLLASTDIKERMIDHVVTLPPKIDHDLSVGDVVGSISYDYEGKPLAQTNLVIRNLNHLAAPAASVFPQEPKYATAFPLPETTTLLYLAIGATLTSLTLLIVTARIKKRKKIQKSKNKILRFSKNVK